MKTLPVFPLAPDPIRPEVSRDAEAVRLTVDPIGPLGGPQQRVPVIRKTLQHAFLRTYGRFKNYRYVAGQQ